MKALSITRPWTELILRGLGGKDVENRTWSTRHRGLFLLHAAQSWKSEALAFAEMAAPDALVGLPTSRDDHPTGIVGVAEIASVCSNEMDEFDDGETWALCRCGRWAMAGQYHWRLSNVRRLPRPVPCRGALGLWTPPEDVTAQVLWQIPTVVNR